MYLHQWITRKLRALLSGRQKSTSETEISASSGQLESHTNLPLTGETLLPGEGIYTIVPIGSPLLEFADFLNSTKDEVDKITGLDVIREYDERDDAAKSYEEAL